MAYTTGTRTYWQACRLRIFASSKFGSFGFKELNYTVPFSYPSFKS